MEFLVKVYSPSSAIVIESLANPANELVVGDSYGFSKVVAD